MNHPLRLLPLVLASLSCAARAATLGLPPAQPLTTGAVEVYHERFRTDIEQEFRLSGGQTFIGEQREDRWLGRSTFQLSEGWRAHALAGGSDSEGSDGSAPMFGAGAEWSVWAEAGAALSLLASTEYVHEITYRKPGGRIGDRVIASEERVESHWEALLGVRASARFDLLRDVALTPYAGVYLNPIQAGAEETFRFPSGSGGNDRNVDFEQDGLVGASTGATLTLPRGWFVRGEASFIDRSSYSIGAGWGF
jgi:hypothetical protein